MILPLMLHRVSFRDIIKLASLEIEAGRVQSFSARTAPARAC